MLCEVMLTLYLESLVVLTGVLNAVDVVATVGAHALHAPTYDIYLIAGAQRNVVN